MAARRNSDDGGSFGKQKRATPFCADSGRDQMSPQTLALPRRVPVVVSGFCGTAVIFHLDIDRADCARYERRSAELSWHRCTPTRAGLRYEQTPRWTLRARVPHPSGCPVTLSLHGSADAPLVCSSNISLWRDRLQVGPFAPTIASINELPQIHLTAGDAVLGPAIIVSYHHCHGSGGQTKYPNVSNFTEHPFLVMYRIGFSVCQD